MLLIFILLAAQSLAFYLPGIAPKDYKQGDSVMVQVNRLTSSILNELDEDAMQSKFISTDYYTPELKFCQPKDGPEAIGGSLGSVLFGDRLYTSPMIFKFLEDVDCGTLCTSTYNAELLSLLMSLTMYDFANHWTIDGLPVAGSYLVDNDVNVLLDEVPVGVTIYPQGGDTKLRDIHYQFYNHFAFTIEYHELPSGELRVVGAVVKPESRNNKPGECSNTTPITLDDEITKDRPFDINYSYSVKWTKSELRWATRWDKYLHVYEPDVNWFALINSLVIVFFLAVLTSLVLTRMFRKDIANYNEVDLSDEISEEMGWKLVHGDVFRQPTAIMLYSIFAGSGAQVGFSIFATTVVAMVGLISPANRGWFSTLLLMFACFGGVIGGYVSAACYKIWGGSAWKTNLILTPIYVPMQVFGMFLLVNFFMIINKASGAVPFGSIAAIVAIWTLISIPLSMAAGFLAFKRTWAEPPVRTNQIPRQIPPQPWYLHIVAVTLVSGALGFLSVSVQMYYIFSAIWFQKLYYMFGFLFTSLFSMVLISVVFNALVLYLTLRAENYHWQWRSFWVSGGTSIYLFIYSIVYMLRYMHLATFTGKLMYIAYSAMGCGLCYLALGFFGVSTSYFLVRKIYARVKMD